MKTFTSALLALVAATVVQAVDKTVNADLDQKLKLATTNVDRQALLKPSDWTFDFTKQAFYTWSPGGVVNANAATFPAAAGLDMTVASLLLGPCAMLPPHYHPRATNFVVAINGSTTTNMIAENGVDMVTTTLTAGQLTIFPKGSLHTMQNNGMPSHSLSVSPHV
jgi:oxalate decarboxylase/phosphoglucose isomerase-like protein (cupin superfamily)